MQTNTSELSKKNSQISSKNDDEVSRKKQKQKVVKIQAIMIKLK